MAYQHSHHQQAYPQNNNYAAQSPNHNANANPMANQQGLATSNRLVLNEVPKQYINAQSPPQVMQQHPNYHVQHGQQAMYNQSHPPPQHQQYNLANNQRVVMNQNHPNHGQIGYPQHPQQYHNNHTHNTQYSVSQDQNPDIPDSDSSDEDDDNEDDDDEHEVVIQMTSNVNTDLDEHSMSANVTYSQNGHTNPHSNQSLSGHSGNPYHQQQYGQIPQNNNNRFNNNTINNNTNMNNNNNNNNTNNEYDDFPSNNVRMHHVHSSSKSRSQSRSHNSQSYHNNNNPNANHFQNNNYAQPPPLSERTNNNNPMMHNSQAPPPQAPQYRHNHPQAPPAQRYQYNKGVVSPPPVPKHKLQKPRQQPPPMNNNNNGPNVYMSPNEAISHHPSVALSDASSGAGGFATQYQPYQIDDDDNDDDDEFVPMHYDHRFSVTKETIQKSLQQRQHKKSQRDRDARNNSNKSGKNQPRIRNRSSNSRSNMSKSKSSGSQPEPLKQSHSNNNSFDNEAQPPPPNSQPPNYKLKKYKKKEVHKVVGQHAGSGYNNSGSGYASPVSQESVHSQKSAHSQKRPKRKNKSRTNSTNETISPRMNKNRGSGKMQMSINAKSNSYVSEEIGRVNTPSIGNDDSETNESEIDMDILSKDRDYRPSVCDKIKHTDTQLNVTIDRFGFPMSDKMDEKEHRKQLKKENARLLKWQDMIFPHKKGGTSAEADNEVDSQIQHWNSVKNHRKLKPRIRKGVPQQLRGTIWQNLCGARERRKIECARYGAKTLYNDLKLKKKSPFHDQIWKDINRTYRKHMQFGATDVAKMKTNQTNLANSNNKNNKRKKNGNNLDAQSRNDNPNKNTQQKFFKSVIHDTSIIHTPQDLEKYATPAQIALYHVLKAFSLYRKDIGYCQGMQAVTALLLMYMTEEESFWVLASLADDTKYQMENLWRPSMPAIKLRFYQMERLVRFTLPKLSSHFEKHGIISASMYQASQWFITIFLATNMEFLTITRVWDIYLNEGLKTVFRMGLGFLKYFEKPLLKSDFETMLGQFKNGAKEIEPEEFIKICFSFKITHAQLAAFERDFNRQNIKQQQMNI